MKPLLPWPPRWALIAALAVLATTPVGQTQYPFYPYPVAPPQPAPIGPTAGATLRSAAAATQNQAALVRRAAGDWGRRANSATYNGDFFQQDFVNMQTQFQMLREQFNWLGAQALQTGRPRAGNAVTELDAGLNIIAELFTFLGSQFNAGTLDRNTVIRTARAFEDAMREWEREFKKSSSRIGLAW